MNILLDENLSPRLVQLLAAKGIPAEHVAHVGLSGASDPEVWRYAYEHDQVVVTINASDFLVLAGSVELHAGLIVLRSRGPSRDEQWEWVEPVIDAVIFAILLGVGGSRQGHQLGERVGAVLAREHQERELGGHGVATTLHPCLVASTSRLG